MDESEVDVTRKKQVTVDRENGVKSERVVQHTSQVATGASYARNVISTIYGILAGLLGIRILLSLLGANSGNAFASFIYTITYPFVAPFRTLFNIDTSIGNGVYRFEVETLVAILVYGLIAWVLIRIFSMRSPSEEV